MTSSGYPMSRSRGKAVSCRLVLALLLVTGVAGCGSGDSGSRDPAADRASFIDQANAICNEANEALRQAMVDSFGSGKEPDDEAGIRFTHQVWVPNLRRQQQDLRALDWPPADRQKLEKMLTELARATDRVEADPALASQGPFDRVTRELTDYGIGPCGSP